MNTFSLLTQNIFGVPTPGTSARLRTLAKSLNTETFSAVCLQEVQAHRYRDLFVNHITNTYPAYAYMPFLHAPKGGLMTFSRLEIDSMEFVLYQERGLWYTPALADWILHKGVLITRMTLNGQRIVVMNTHLTANYMGYWGKGNAFAEHEYRQLMELCELVHAQPADALLIVCGDFNVPRASWLYESFMVSSHLCDPRAEEMQPTFRPHAGMGPRFAAPIDYALYRAPLLHNLHVESKMCFQEPVQVGGKPTYLSDHNGIELRLSWDNPL